MHVAVSERGCDLSMAAQQSSCFFQSELTWVHLRITSIHVTLHYFLSYPVMAMLHYVDWIRIKHKSNSM